MAAKTERTLRRNILDLIAEIIPAEDYRLNSGLGECTIFGRKIYLVGANDERAENKIRGITLYAAYCDELTLFPESFVQMLLSRLSEPKAILLATTNPDSPYHFVKTNFLDRSDTLNLKSWKFLLEDNNTLPSDYIQDLKAEYVPGSVWYKRYILGLWVAAEGAIYDMFDESRHVVSELPEFASVVVGVDYGTVNPTSFIALGYDIANKRWIAFKEYYYDSAKKGRQKTDAEYAADMKDFLKDIHPSNVLIDPSAASFRAVLRQQGVHGLADADNSVLDGIRSVATGFTSGRLVVHESCTHLIEELPGYVWDSKAQDKGEDKPLKQADHALDALRYGYMRAIQQRII